MGTAIADEIAGFLSSGMWMTETDLGQHGVLATRRPLIDSILNTTFDGIAGKFKLVNGERLLPLYEIVNITGNGAISLGLWTPLSLISQNLSTEGSSFDNNRSGSGNP
uniref:Receptor ligand binding region domain-containing protein n=1 Tax=Arundo donax TaxID=35708 RepID=A0A0A9CW51_ARUDO